MTRFSATLAAFGSLLLALLTAAGCGETVAAPSSYQRWNAKDATFSIDYPDGWKAEGGGQHGLQWAEFQKGGCKITVNTNTSSSLIGDIAESANTSLSGGEALPAELEEELAPVAQVHELNLEAYPPPFKAYKEEPATKFTSSLGDGRKSAFTASHGLGQKIRGYRATVLSNDKGILIYCYCPDKDWAKFQPAYDKILDSLAYGQQ